MWIHIGAPLECTACISNRIHTWMNQDLCTYSTNVERHTCTQKKQSFIKLVAGMEFSFAPRHTRSAFLTSDCEFIRWKFIVGYETTLMAMQEIRHETKLHAWSLEFILRPIGKRVDNEPAEEVKKCCSVNNAGINTAFEIWDDNSKLFHRLNN